LLSMDDIYKAHAQTVYRYLLSLTRDADMAQELTQETFYQAVRSAERFDGSCKISTWLCAIAKNQHLAYRRKHPPTDLMDMETASADSMETNVMAAMDRVELLKKLHQLDNPGREVMYLRLFGDLSFREIGEILGETENWARVNYYRGKEKLKKEIKKDG